MSRVSLALLGLWACCAWSGAWSGSAAGATFTVTTLDAAGPGSLSDSVGQANGTPGADTIIIAVIVALFRSARYWVFFPEGD